MNCKTSYMKMDICSGSFPNMKIYSMQFSLTISLRILMNVFSSVA